MIRLLVFRFWPALLPLLIYWVWHLFAVRKAKKEGKPVPRFRDGPIYWLVLASLLIAAGCFFYWGARLEPQKGDYAPPRLENGKMIPGRVE